MIISNRFLLIKVNSIDAFKDNFFQFFLLTLVDWVFQEQSLETIVLNRSLCKHYGKDSVYFTYIEVQAQGVNLNKGIAWNMLCSTDSSKFVISKTLEWSIFSFDFAGTCIILYSKRHHIIFLLKMNNIKCESG